MSKFLGVAKDELTSNQINQARSAGNGNTSLLLSWALAEAFTLASATRDVNDAVVTASITWPDGMAGILTTDLASSLFPGSVDAWHATYAGNPAKIVTQATVTRDASGAIIAQPAITIV